MAKTTTTTLRAEIARLEEQHALAERLEGAEGALAQAQAELGGAQQQLASLKTQILAEQARLKELEQAQQDARAGLQAAHREREAVERELRAFGLQADQQDRDFVARLHGVIPEEPELTPEEANLA